MEQPAKRKVLVEIIAKKKGCVLCDLAIGILEEVASELGDGVLAWEVVDVGEREGLNRCAELAKICGRRLSAPSIVINEKVAFDHIPDYESLNKAVLEAVSGPNERRRS
ncbi:MAG: hypothetical protein M1378_06375 [Bacteroidetes bacterium]|jgi:hypothetical protein|nr:hypothetical protein [Bacteroidota bacterium]MDA8308013.1 hypothetical protein [Deltaproteobacteria bacterium]